MPIPTLTGPIGTRLTDLRSALAGSAAFRAWVGVVDDDYEDLAAAATAARAYIFLFSADYSGTPARFGVIGYPRAFTWNRDTDYGAVGMGAANVTWKLNLGLVELLDAGTDVNEAASTDFINLVDGVLLDLVGTPDLLLQTVELDEDGSGQLPLGERTGYQFAFNVEGRA